MPVELEHRAYWAIKKINFDWKEAGERRKLELNELDEIRNEAYENARIYKDKTKKLHDKLLVKKTIVAGQKVLLFNSRLRLFPGKLKSRWSGPYVVNKVYPSGVVELQDYKKNETFKVNGHRVKSYFDTRENLSELDLALRDPPDH